MMLSNLTFVALAAEEMTIADKAVSSAKVILTGFVVVFSMLLLLIGIIKIYSFIVNKAQGAFDKKTKEKIPDSAPLPTISSIPPTDHTEPEIEDGIPEEVVAVIAAAVADNLGAGVKARIKSIKKAPSGARSAWANAGIRENTRPF